VLQVSISFSKKDKMNIISQSGVGSFISVPGNTFQFHAFEEWDFCIAGGAKWIQHKNVK
jgi:hypothetical protein